MVKVSGSARLDHLLWFSQDKILRTVVNRNGGPPTAEFLPSLSFSLVLRSYIDRSDDCQRHSWYVKTLRHVPTSCVPFATVGNDHLGWSCHQEYDVKRIDSSVILAARAMSTSRGTSCFEYFNTSLGKIFSYKLIEKSCLWNGVVLRKPAIFTIRL